MVKPTAIDLFSGAGGMSAGFHAAGFHVIAALESVNVFAETHKLNFSDCETVSESIDGLKPQDFALRTGVRRGDVDVLIGGPPCQPFSNIGAPKIKSLNRETAKTDARTYLIHPFLDYAEYFSPRAVLIENVPQLRTKDGGRLFQSALKKLAALGYRVNWAQLNAVEFGVPQNRRRLFVAAVKGEEAYRFPGVTHFGGGEAEQQLPLSSEALKPCVTVKEAIDDLPLINDGARLGMLPYSKNAGLSDFQLLVRGAEEMVGNNVCRVSNERAKRVFRHMAPGSRYMELPPEVRQILPFREDIFHDRLKRLHPDKPSWTVLAHIGMDGYMYIHPWENRTLSVREAARLQSFPDNFRFLGNMREQYVQVGNAVPPFLAKRLAATLLPQISSDKGIERAHLYVR